MPTFKLQKSAYFGLDGQQSCIERRIEKQTERAVLLAVINQSSAGGRKVCYWLPKSQIKIDGETPVGEIWIGRAKKIEVPDWLWEKRVPV